MMRGPFRTCLQKKLNPYRAWQGVLDVNTSSELQQEDYGIIPKRFLTGGPGVVEAIAVDDDGITDFWTTDGKTAS